MKVSLNWLSDYIDLAPSRPEETAQVLESLGHEVEETERLSPDFGRVVTARVVEVEAHPRADRIRVCRVTAGDEPQTVVCGAWNFEAGATVAWALPGATLSGGTEIGRRSILGVESNGMICSERELGLGDDAEGILVFDAGVALGEDLAGFGSLTDTVLDLSITPNRPDVMSYVGVARELAAYHRIDYRLPEPVFPQVDGRSRIGITIEDPTGCYRFVSREVRGCRVSPSPFWMRTRLRASGQRPISNVVDITNYVLLELGQPIHAFDLEELGGHRIVVRRAYPGERLTTLDGVARDLTPSDLVVADHERASALAGTMGGGASEVTEKTTEVLIEAASWDPPTVLHMSKRHGLRTEASARFERGVDPALAPAAATRAAQLVHRLAGGQALAEMTDVVARSDRLRPVTIDFELREAERILGPGFDTTRVTDLLSRLHLGVEGDDPIRVEVPTFRPDLTRPADLVEELARLWGYNNFPERVPRGPGGGRSDSQRRTRTLRQALCGLGFSESVSLSFMRASEIDAWGWDDQDERARVIHLKNPLREEESILRTTLLPGLLRVARYNHSHGLDEVAIFEMGRVFLDRPHQVLPKVPDQPERVGLLATGRLGGSGLGVTRRPVDFYTVSAVWRALSHQLDFEDWRLEPVETAGWHPARAARLLLDGEQVGIMGEVHPAVVRRAELSGRVIAMELDLAPLVSDRRHWQFRAPSVFPPYTFDMAFEAPEGLAADDLLSATGEAAGEVLESARVFDEFRGDPLGRGRKSLAINYTLRAPDRTLSSEETGEALRSMAEAARALGAELRGDL
ncbi:MAG: phenylalanine--tRNA ligase subunit beta [Acidimicrobiia bacterium]|nr:phenylalanine--tRNA ligase subunit beta [Acidimicrobiia bacterium]